MSYQGLVINRRDLLATISVAVISRSLHASATVEEIAPAYRSLALPHFHGGHFFIRGVEFRSMIVLDNTGQFIFEFRPQFDELSQWTLGAGATRPKGDGFVMAGGGLGPKGAVHFLVWLDAKGSPQRTVLTTPYYAEDLAFDSEGSLWALVSRPPQLALGLSRNWPVLRRYRGSDGVIMGTALSREVFDEFPGKGSPTEEGRMAIHGDVVHVASVRRGCCLTYDWRASAVAAKSAIQGFEPGDIAMAMYASNRDTTLVMFSPKRSNRLIYRRRHGQGNWTMEADGPDIPAGFDETSQQEVRLGAHGKIVKTPL